MDKSNYEEKLKKICKNCKRANGRCIIDDPYIGLCAVTLPNLLRNGNAQACHTLCCITEAASETTKLKTWF